LIGADPEFVLLNPPHVVNTYANNRYRAISVDYGYDHGGYVIEPHPEPALSVRQVVKNIKKCLVTVGKENTIGHKWRAGAYITTPERGISLGGHVHVDRLNPTTDQLRAYDTFTGNLERLDILPRNESIYRRGHSAYGNWGDVRCEHGRHEYRSMCSWLFSSKAATLSMTGIKLAVVAPETVERLDSIEGLKAWYEKFYGKDDDVDWILNKGYFDKSLEAVPDTDVKEPWGIEKALALEIKKKPEQERSPLNDMQQVYLEGLRQRNLAEEAVVARAQELANARRLREERVYLNAGIDWGNF